MECLRSMISYDPCTIAYRSTGSIPVPMRKGSTPQNSVIYPKKGKSKRNSCPVLPCTLTGPDHNYGVQFKLKLNHATLDSIMFDSEDVIETSDVLKNVTCKCQRLIHQQSTGATQKPKISKTHIEGRAVTRSPDILKEIKRNSMKEKWGLELVYRLNEETMSLEIMVTKVGFASPCARAGFKAGNILTLVNDWKIEAMQVPESIQTILMAGGFFITLGWLDTEKHSEIGSEWQNLGKF